MRFAPNALRSSDSAVYTCSSPDEPCPLQEKTQLLLFYFHIHTDFVQAPPLTLDCAHLDKCAFREGLAPFLIDPESEDAAHSFCTYGAGGGSVRCVHSRFAGPACSR